MNNTHLSCIDFQIAIPLITQSSSPGEHKVTQIIKALVQSQDGVLS